MNALINLKECREYMTLYINETSHQIKLAGTLNDPYFCGRDICNVLGYRDSKTAIKKFTEEEDRSNLENLKVNCNLPMGGTNCPPHHLVNFDHLGSSINPKWRFKY